jgi:hypothetical protein
LIEEFHLAVFVPGDLPAKQARAVKRELDGVRLQREILSAVRSVVAAHPRLKVVAVKLSR